MLKTLRNFERDNNIWKDKQAGMHITEIMTKYKLSKPRVYQIIRKIEWRKENNIL